MIKTQSGNVENIYTFERTFVHENNLNNKTRVANE